MERITYANEDTGYTIARVATERTGPDLLTVVGPLLGAQIGESLRLTGRWSSHPKYGRQFEVDAYTTVLPATIQGIRRYLGSGLIKGIGPMIGFRSRCFQNASTQDRDPLVCLPLVGLAAFQKSARFAGLQFERRGRDSNPRWSVNPILA